MKETRTLRISKAVLRRSACNTWHCEEDATHIIFYRARGKRAKSRAVSAYCNVCTADWLLQGRVASFYFAVERQVILSLDE